MRQDLKYKVITDAQNNCFQFLKSALKRRNLDSHLRLDVSRHMMERLCIDRAHEITVKGFCSIICKVLDQNACELIYLAELVKDLDRNSYRLVVTYKAIGVSLGFSVNKTNSTRYGKISLVLTTIYKGVDEYDMFTYYRLTI